MRHLQEMGKELRIRSLFGEPAELCSYLLLPITINLFMNKKKRGRMLLSLLYSFVCVVSMSSTGIIMTAFLWSIYLIKMIRDDKRGMIVGLIVFAISAVGVTTSGIWRYFIDRTFGGGLSGSTRFNSILEMFNASGTLSGVLFGQGMSELEIFLPGFARLYLYLGLVGILTFTAYFVINYKKTVQEQKYVLLVFLILNIGTPVLLGCFALPYLVFMFAENRDEINRDFQEGRAAWAKRRSHMPARGF